MTSRGTGVRDPPYEMHGREELRRLPAQAEGRSISASQQGLTEMALCRTTNETCRPVPATKHTTKQLTARACEVVWRGGDRLCGRSLRCWSERWDLGFIGLSSDRWSLPSAVPRLSGVTHV